MANKTDATTEEKAPVSMSEGDAGLKKRSSTSKASVVEVEVGSVHKTKIDDDEEDKPEYVDGAPVIRTGTTLFLVERRNNGRLTISRPRCRQVSHLGP